MSPSGISSDISGGAAPGASTPAGSVSGPAMLGRAGISAGAVLGVSASTSSACDAATPWKAEISGRTDPGGSSSMGPASGVAVPDRRTALPPTLALHPRFPLQLTQLCQSEQEKGYQPEQSFQRMTRATSEHHPHDLPQKHSTKEPPTATTEGSNRQHHYKS